MTRRSIVRRRFSVLATALALSGLTACGSSGGPLQTAAAGGQPNFDVAWSFEVPGQPAEMTAYLVNSAPGQDPVTLVSASLIPISGHPTGRLVGLAVARDHDGVAAARGWPPRGVPFRAFPGALLPRGQSNIIFGFEGAQAGRDYMTAGLKIAYRYHGRLYTVLSWSSAVTCVTPDRNASMSACERASEVAKRATEQMADVH